MRVYGFIRVQMCVYMCMGRLHACMRMHACVDAVCACVHVCARAYIVCVYVHVYVLLCMRVCTCISAYMRVNQANKQSNHHYTKQSITNLDP